MEYNTLPIDMQKKIALCNAIKLTITEGFPELNDKLAVCGMLINGILDDELEVASEEHVRSMMDMWLKHVESGFDLALTMRSANNN